MTIKVEKRTEIIPQKSSIFQIDKSKPVKLDLGSGLNQMPHSDGWIHQDGSPANGIEIVCDWENMPIESGIVDEIRLGDVIEHIPGWKRDVILKEWNRIMKIGCKCHLTTPNFEWTVFQYSLGKMSYELAQQNLYGDRANYYCTHYLTYTKDELKKVLELYGFGEIDFSESPGGNENGAPWWIVANFKKIKNV